MLKILTKVLFEIFFIIGIGYLVRKKNIITDSDSRSVNTVCMKIILFFTLVVSSQKEFSVNGARAIGITTVVSILYFAIGLPMILLISKKMEFSEGKRKVFVLSSLFSNTIFVGFPITQRLLGDIAALCTVVFNAIGTCIFYTWAFAYLGPGNKFDFKSIYSSPIALISMISIMLYFFQIKIPEPFLSAFSIIANANLPLSMLVIGSLLASADIKRLLVTKGVFLANCIKMLIIPAIVFSVMRLLNCDDIAVKACTIIAALPVGVVTSSAAVYFGVEAEYAAEIMVLSVLIMLITLPIWSFVIFL